MSDQYDATWTASADELAALQDLQAQLAAQREQTAAERAAAQEELAGLTAARGQVQTQTRGLQGDIGSFRAEQQLAADAARTVSAELAAGAGGDFYSPDVGQRIAPDGTVTYDFDAHLHARGVDLDAVYAAVDSQIRWLRTTDGAVIAQLDAFPQTDTQRFARYMGHASTVQSMTSSLIAAHDDIAGNDASMNALAGGAQTSQVFARVGAIERMVLDVNGKSDFMRLATPGAPRLAFGGFDAVWPVAGVTSGWITVAHGLGVVPKTVLVTCTSRTDGGSVAVPSVNNQTVGVSNFQVSIWAGGASIAAGVAVGVYWVAIAP